MKSLKFEKKKNGLKSFDYIRQFSEFDGNKWRVEK